MDPTLLASISRLETSDVGEALQAVLRQAETVLRPASKYPRPRQSKLPSTPSIDKKAFARSMLALLQHASTLSATESALHGELVSLLATAMQQQPWLWEFFVKRHLSDLLSQPGAAALLSDSVCRLHPATQARNWSVLCGELRTMPLIGINDALAIAAFQRAALSQVRCCFRLITHDLPSSVAPGATAPAAAAVYRGHATGYATRENGISSNAQVHVTLTQYLPAALQVLIMQRGGSYHPYGSGNDIVKAAADASASSAGGGARRQQQASECTAGSSAHSGAWVGEGEQDKGFAYAATLVEQMCSPELLAQLLNLGNLESSDRIGSTVPRPSVGTSLQSIETRVPGGSLGGARTRNEEADEGGAAAAGFSCNRMTEDAVQRIHAAMMIVPVLVEALLTIPDVARRASRPPAVAISTLLAVRWELAQLLAAAGSGKMTATKSAPAPWSLQTATALLEATLVHADGVAGPSIQQQSNVLVMPPAVVSHALEIVKAALPRWSEFKNVAPDGGIHKDAIHFLDVILRLQSACFCGVFQPHISVRSGPANQEAMLAAHRLHVLLVSDSSSDGGSRGAGTTVEKTLLSHGAERAAGNTKQRKRHSSSSSRHTAKQQQGAVAAFLELLARPQTAEPNNMRGDVDLLEKLQEAAAPGASPEDESVKNNAGGASPHQPPPRKRRIVAEQIGDLARAPDPQAASDEAEATATLIAAFSDGAGNEASVGGATAAGDDASNAATAGQQAPALMEEGDQVPGAESLAAGGRVVMTSTLLMDDAAREAMWKAYIQDKERMVEMLGDSSYREYYDEAAHPTPAVAPKTGNIDAAFDAVFGEARQVVTASYSGDTAPTLPQTILETSLLYPWQAALAAALQVLTWIVGTSEALSFTAADLVLGKLATAEQRKGAAAAALKALEPNHSRNTWLGVQRAAEVHLASGNALFVVSSLRTLLQRTSRRTAPPTLAAFVSLARALLPRAQLEEAQDGDAMAGTSNKSTLLPLRFVGPLVRGFSRFPPLLAASLNAESAVALPVLAAAGCISSRGGGGGSVDTLPYLAGLLWLALAAEDSPTPPRPHWLVDQGAELTAHPLVAAAPVCRTAAVKELLPLVIAAAKALNSSCLGDDQQRQSQRRGEHQRDEFDVHAALPALDACAALLGYIHCRWNEQPSAFGEGHQPLADTKRACATDPTRSAGPKHVERASALLETGALIGSASTSRLCLGPEGVLQAMHLAAALCTWCNAASEGLAALLDGADASALSQGTLDDIEARAEVLAVGLELTDVARAALEGPLAATMVINGLPNEHQTAFCELTTVVERCDAALASALEILRTLGEDSAGYVVALRGMDAAPQLALLPLAVAVTAPEQGDQDPQQGPIARPVHQEGSEEAKVDPSAKGGHGTSRRSAYQRRRRLHDIRNPYLRAIVAESRRDAGDVADGDLSDLEDFIVANPERDYGEFISSHFPMAVDSDEDEDEDDADKDAGGDGDVDGDEVKQGE